MSDIQASAIVDPVNNFKDKFYEQLNLVYSERKVKRPWNLDQYKEIIEIIKESKLKALKGVRRSNSEYYYSQKYDIMEIGGVTKIILKQKTADDSIVYVVPLEDYFKIIEDCHKSTGHGRRDKIMYILKEKNTITRFAVETYLKLCIVCASKKTTAKKGLVVRPITSNDFNSRGQVDLMDFQSISDGEYKWLLNYQDHLTKFLYLRPLRTKRAAEVAFELLKIFLTQGAPSILQSDNGKEFVAAVVSELMDLWPDCKIIHGRPRHPETQGSVERANQDVEEMLKAWMKENDCTKWSVGCYYVQWQKNISFHRTIGRSPYKALYGGEPKVGLQSTNIPKELLEKIMTEDDLASYTQETEECDEHLQTENNNDSRLTREGSENFHSNPPQSENTYDHAEPDASEISEDHLVCCVCKEESSGAHRCSYCNNVVHVICGRETEDGNGDYGSKLICNLCEKQNLLVLNRKGAKIGQEVAAKKMKLSSGEKFPLIEKGASVLVAVPKVDRGPLDDRNIPGYVMETRNGLYQVGTSAGILKTWCARNQIQQVANVSFNIQDIPTDKQVSVREASSKHSPYNGQGFSKCACKKECATRKCACFRKKQLCGSRCHGSLTCKNK